jgi:hypothetical protein
MEFGQRPMALVPRLPRARLVIAALVFGVAVAGAAALYFHPFNALACDSHGASFFCGRPGTASITPGWVLPAAAALCLLGAAGAFGVLTARRGIAIAAVILGVTLGAAAVVYADYDGAFFWCVPGTELRRIGNTYFPPGCTPHTLYWRAGWMAPTALGLVALGVVAAVGVLVALRRREPLAPE